VLVFALPLAVESLPVAQKPLTVNGVEMAVALSAVASRVYPICPRSIIRFGKVAIPLALVVARGDPKRTAVEHAGFPKFMATWTPGMTAPVASDTRTCTAGEIACEPTALLGCTTKATCAGGPTVVTIIV
jgi:hypothetical protein